VRVEHRHWWGVKVPSVLRQRGTAQRRLHVVFPQAGEGAVVPLVELPARVDGRDRRTIVAVNARSLQAQRQSVGSAAQLGSVALVHMEAVGADGFARSPRLCFAVRRETNVEPARKSTQRCDLMIWSMNIMVRT